MDKVKKTIYLPEGLVEEINEQARLSRRNFSSQVLYNLEECRRREGAHGSIPVEAWSLVRFQENFDEDK